MGSSWYEPPVEHEQAGESPESTGTGGLWDRLSDALPAEQMARQRLAFLAEASTVLGRSLDVEETLQQLADLTVPQLADWCTIELFEGGQLRPAAVAHTDPAKIPKVRELRDRYGYAHQHGPGRVARTGEPELIEEVTDGLLASVAHDDEHLALMRDLGPVSLVAVPLVSRGRVLGAVTLAQSESGRHYRDEDLELLQDVAQRAATAVDNAVLYAERDRVARTLQQALLPPKLPDPPGLDLAAVYDTADDVDIGGDFYDVIDTPQGWVVVLGDVCGKGVQAASLSSLARHTVRSAALQDGDPAHVLGVLNDALLRQDPSESFCTALCVQLRLAPRRAEVVLASAGHPPALMVRANGSIAQMDGDGMLVGAFDEPVFERTRDTLHPGDLLMLYTDGLSEARHGGELFGTEGIISALRHAPAEDAESVLAHVHATVEGWQDGQRDDVAMLAIQFNP